MAPTAAPTAQAPRPTDIQRRNVAAAIAKAAAATHGVHAAGHGKKVTHRLGALLDVNIGREIDICARREVLEDVMDVAVDFGCYPVNFHAVAGGQDNNFGKVRADFQSASVAMEPRGVDRELLA